MKPPLCISAIAGIITFILYIGYLEVTRLTGGKLKKLEEIDRSLAEKLNESHPLPERVRLAGRLMIFIFAIITVAQLFATFTGKTAPEPQHHPFPWMLVIIPLIYFIAEFFTAPLSLLANAKIAASFIPVFHVASWILFPIIWLLELPGHQAWKRDNDQNENNNLITTEDEILSLIDKKEEGDTPENYIDDIEEDERRIVTGAFQLDNTTVHEIMTPRVDIDAIDAEASVDELTTLILESGHSRIPVYKENIDQIIGVIFAKDLLDKAKVSQARSLEDLIRPPFYTPESKIIGDLLAEFQKQKTHFAIVIDEYGGTSGIVTFEDILEELVGEIQDEYDVDETEETEMKPDADGWYTLDARCPITDISDQLEIEFPDDADYDTIGGYLAAETGKILQTGDKQDTDLFSIEVLDASPRCVKKIRLKKLPEA